ncbi:MAG: hypothetical protein KDD38_00030 [Bdellovibrionales bacterium]|nr:hypothetical protein [Bdellovibrionales bacterium]
MTKIVLSIFIIAATYYSTPTFALDKNLADALALGASRGLSLEVKSREVISSSASSIVFELQLYNKLTGDIKLYERVPVLRTKGRLPTTFVLSGLQTGRDAIFLVPEIEDMRVVTYEYPFGESTDPQAMLSQAGQKILLMNAQIVAAYLWLTQQADVDPAGLYSLNISFGSFVAPYALRILAEMGISPSRTVFAFGGSDLAPFFHPLLKRDLKIDVDPEKVMNLTEKLSVAVSPTQHLKHLKGPFLIIRGLKDNTIPELSSMSLYNNLPEPKMLIELNTEHINTDKPDVILETMTSVVNWLSQ